MGQIRVSQDAVGVGNRIVTTVGLRLLGQRRLRRILEDLARITTTQETPTFAHEVMCPYYAKVVTQTTKMLAAKMPLPKAQKEPGRAGTPKP